MQGNKLQLSLGFSHPVEMDIPAGLSVKVENNTKIEITPDKQLLGQLLQKYALSGCLSLCGKGEIC